MRLKKFLLCVMAIVCLLTSLPLTTVYAITLEQLSTDSTSIDVHFHDDGADLTTLTKDNIFATLDGSPIEVESLGQAKQRTNYTFLLDISRSVKDNYMNAAKEQILEIYKNLNDEDLLSVITFGSEAKLVLDGTESYEEASEILNGISCNNWYTHFYEAINLMLDRLENTIDMHNVAVVVSDGLNTGDVTTSVDSLKSRLSGSGISLYALAVDSATSYAIDSFRKFVEVSGGKLFTFAPETCSSAMDELLLSVDTVWNVNLEVNPAYITGQPQTLYLQIGEFGTIQKTVILEAREIDTTPPAITNWQMDAENGTLALYFSEAMADLKDSSHYKITTGLEQTVVPVTVLEHTEDYVLLSIPDFTDIPGWRIDFIRLMDASANRNLLKDKILLLTPEITPEPTPTIEVTPTPDTTPTLSPDITGTPGPDVSPTPGGFGEKEPFATVLLNFLMKYAFIGIGVALIILILCMVIISNRKRRTPKHKIPTRHSSGTASSADSESSIEGLEEITSTDQQAGEFNPNTYGRKKTLRAKIFSFFLFGGKALKKKKLQESDVATAENASAIDLMNPDGTTQGDDATSKKSAGAGFIAGKLTEAFDLKLPSKKGSKNSSKDAAKNAPVDEAANETAGDSVEKVTDETTGDSVEKTTDMTASNSDETSKPAFKVTDTTVKSGSFSLSGVSKNRKQPRFSIPIKQNPKPAEAKIKNPEKLQEDVKTEKLMQDTAANTKPKYTGPSFSGPAKSKSYTSSKSKKTSISFGSNNKKKKN